MTFEEYEELAKRTRNNTDDAILNAVMGLCGEAGEVCEVVKKEWFHGKGADLNAYVSELGDVLFYLAWLASLKGITLSEVAESNISKLRARYPKGFEQGGGVR